MHWLLFEVKAHSIELPGNWNISVKMGQKPITQDVNYMDVR